MLLLQTKMNRATTSKGTAPLRQKNWTLDEKLELVREVEARKYQILGKFGPTVTTKTKRRAWDQVANSMTRRHQVPRSVKQLQEAWRKLLKKCRTLYRLYKEHDQRTGKFQYLRYKNRKKGDICKIFIGNFGCTVQIY